MAGESRTAVAAALAGNAALAVLKGIAAAVTGSAAMLAETCHSVADTGNEALLFLGMRLARRPADERHPFGHGQEVYFWSFMVAIMLFTLGGGFSIWEGVQHVVHPSERRSVGWAYGVLAGSFLFELGSLLIAVRSLCRAKANRTVRQFWRETRDPTLLMVLCEDTAALASLIVAAAGITVAHWSGSAVWDAGASMLIGLVLIAVAVFLAVENYSLLMGKRAPRDIERAIESLVKADDQVRAVRSVRTMHLGPQSVLIAVSVDFDPDLDTEAVAGAATRIRARLAERFGRITNSRLIVIDPSVVRSLPRPAA